MGSLVNIEELSAHLNLGKRRVQGLIALGIIARPTKGRFDVLDSLKRYIVYLQNAAARRESLGGGAAVQAARAQLLSTRTEDAQISLAERRGELIPISVFAERMGAMISTARQQLLQLPARVAPSLEGENRAVIKDKLTRAVNAALVSLSQGPQGEPEADDHGKANGSTAGTAAPANGAMADGKT
jgi:hypothetical protein